MQVAVVPLESDHLDDAARLLSTRHGAERERFPLLPAEFERPGRCADLVDALAQFAVGAAAFDPDGRLVGFMTWVDAAPDPASPIARYAPERAALHLVHGHAVAVDLDPFPVTAALYTETARASVERGVLDHVVHTPLGDARLEAAWVALGFGRMNVVAVRDLSPLEHPGNHAVDVRVATVDELDIVDDLIDVESVFHAGSPIFRPRRRTETAEQVRAELVEQLAGDAHDVLVARVDGADVGVLCVGPGVGSPLYVPDGAAYVAATAVRPEARTGGVGSRLLSAAIEWSHAHGHRAMVLHFSAANAVSTRFWTGAGFAPVMAHLRRRVPL